MYAKNMAEILPIRRKTLFNQSRLHMSEKFPSGTLNSKQTNKNQPINQPKNTFLVFRLSNEILVLYKPLKMLHE